MNDYCKKHIKQRTPLQLYNRLVELDSLLYKVGPDLKPGLHQERLRVIDRLKEVDSKLLEKSKLIDAARET